MAHNVETVKFEMLVRNWITTMLHVLQNRETENSKQSILFRFRNSLAEFNEAKRILGTEVLQIIQENGTKALIIPVVLMCVHYIRRKTGFPDIFEA